MTSQPATAASHEASDSTMNNAATTFDASRSSTAGLTPTDLASSSNPVGKYLQLYLLFSFLSFC